jgi:hypothetical protein
LPGGLAVVVNARPSAALVSFQELASDFGSALERAIARLPARAVP